MGVSARGRALLTSFSTLSIMILKEKRIKEGTGCSPASPPFPAASTARALRSCEREKLDGEE
eukprot:8542916-Alexandrium_andersonii.AAC.1